MDFTRKNVHHILYLCCLLTLAAAIPLSNYVMSMGGIFLFSNWVFEGDYLTKWNRLKKNKLAWVLMLFFFVLLISFIHTDNWKEGFTQILSKLPFFYAPLVMATSDPLNEKEKNGVLYFFLIATFIGTMFGMVKWITNQYNDLRELSFFISHIRFSICVLFAAVLSCYLAFKKRKYSLLFLIPALWFVSYLLISQTLTGIILGFILMIVLSIYWLRNHFQKWQIKLYMGLGVGIFLAFVGYLTYIVSDYYIVEQDFTKNLPAQTINGNPYTHQDNSIIENGSPVYQCVCEQELMTAWGQRSAIPYDENIKHTLIRFLNSKGCNKDSAAVASLTNEEILLIEKGIANKDYVNKLGFKASIYPTLFGLSLYQKYGKTSQSSLFQRFELWRISWGLIQQNRWFGVGIGDHKAMIDKQIEIENSEMIYKKNMGCHNQFLTYWLCGGLIPVLYFLWMLLAPFFLRKKNISLLYLLFFCIIFFSLFMEDTFETQPGITFYTFFNALLLFVLPKNK
ncbi:MAG: O-antigen ligase family protein [Bacteroidales bacterium]|jgi:O-antigen ligase|nr:O-antigen ligase family protein [Bacteroidales bacterium]